MTSVILFFLLVLIKVFTVFLSHKGLDFANVIRIVRERLFLRKRCYYVWLWRFWSLWGLSEWNLGLSSFNFLQIFFSSVFFFKLSLVDFVGLRLFPLNFSRNIRFLFKFEVMTVVDHNCLGFLCPVNFRKDIELGRRRWGTRLNILLRIVRLLRIARLILGNRSTYPWRGTLKSYGRIIVMNFRRRRSKLRMW